MSVAGDRGSRILHEQAEYYRARAPEYDRWFFREGRYTSSRRRMMKSWCDVSV